MLRRAFATFSMVLLGFCFLAQSAQSQSLQNFEDKVTEFTLDN